MNTPSPSDPRALAHRLTTIGHALHHRLFAQLHDSDIHPKTVLLLGAIDGRIDAPWVADRLARGGKRLSALADRGWVTRADDGWSLTDDGRALLDRVDAERSAVLADVPAEHLANLTSALDALAKVLEVDDAEAAGPGRRGGFRYGFGVVPGAGMRGFGPDPRRAFGPNEHRGFRVGERGSDSAARHPVHPADRAGFGPSERSHGEHVRDSHLHDEHGHGIHGARHHGERDHGENGRGGHRPDRRRAHERAFERGFDAGFQRGREAGSPPAAQD
ncbi:MarR family winged helix-turn-helix transcriptional regulator [Microbacterium sp. VKM Ac-2923]|uniref:MarR family winged helix-turn-helix transcriptional regulator n=1 Tax=Microbacterium sp. VKM Ac-2923 TaxID=2929476 RepID=UPI001FB329F1|nr:hypothetical protein [Microbacterium sp. VKM Ac-2923]MCJ1708415.1 hypothetical protein [Microbacterium sp. VKM Ac-2923]